MIQVTALGQKNSFYLKIKGRSLKDRKIYSKIETLYNALLSLVEKDDRVIKLKNTSNQNGLRLAITGGRHTEGAFNMVLSGIREIEREHPKNITLNERMN
ncbi:MAG: hypothetical protein IJX50_01485 [Clostridia bacterium]|nr:hypothetical protein [Clostridia bacterium]